MNLAFSQSTIEIDSLLNRIAEIESSKDIIKTDQALKIISYGKKSLPILSGYFADTTQTKLYSECNNRTLKRGEIAIIMADAIQRMPYLRITGIQYCDIIYCQDNPNWIEYYLYAINRGGLDNFQRNFNEWLAYTELSDKEKRKVDRQKKRGFQSQYPE